MTVNKTGVNKENTKHYRIWKSSPNAEASIMVTPKDALLIANPRNFVAASPAGVTLTGNVTLNCLSDQVRVGGLFVQMNDWVRLIPSTLITPIPPVIPFPPIALPLAILNPLPFFIAMLVI